MLLLQIPLQFRIHFQMGPDAINIFGNCSFTLKILKKLKMVNWNKNYTLCGTFSYFDGFRIHSFEFSVDHNSTSIRKIVTVNSLNATNFHRYSVFKLYSVFLRPQSTFFFKFNNSILHHFWLSVWIFQILNKIMLSVKISRALIYSVKYREENPLSAHFQSEIPIA